MNNQTSIIFNHEKESIPILKEEENNYFIKIFESELNHYMYLAYLDQFFNIKIYNLDCSEISNTFTNNDFSSKCFFDYCFDSNYKKDLLLYRNYENNNNVIIYNLTDSSIFLKIEKINIINSLDFSLLLKIKKKIFLIVASRNDNKEKIKNQNANIIYFNKDLFQVIDGSNSKTFFIHRYYDDEKKIFLLTGNEESTQSYFYSSKFIPYYNFKDNYGIKKGNNINGHLFSDNNTTLLAIQTNLGYIMIWDFKKRKLLNNISFYKYLPFCFIDTKKILVYCDEELDLVSLQTNQIVERIEYEDEVIKIEKIFIQKYHGPCMILQESENGSIKIY